MAIRPGYLFSISGLQQIFELLISIIVTICVSTATSWWGGSRYMYFTSIFSMITIIIFTGFYLFDIVNAFGQLPWGFMRLVHAVFWSIFYFIAIWVAVAGTKTNSSSTNYQAYTAAAVFCAFQFAVFTWDAIYQFFLHRVTSGTPAV